MKEFLRTVSLFSGFKDEEIELLARTARERSFPEGAHIVRIGEPGTSAFVLEQGAADALLEKPGGKPVLLSKIGPGEIFGEIALYDGEPRSASVVATQDTTVIELNRELFLLEIARRPETSLKLLAAIAKRLRRSEGIVSNFADRIYGDVLPRLEAAVSAQLDSAKTICEQSKERVAQTSEHANRVVAQVENRWTLLTRVAFIVGGALSLAAAFGIYNLEKTRESYAKDFEKTVSEAKDLKKEAKGLLAAVRDDRRALNVLKENSLWMDKLRHDLQLEEGADFSHTSGDNQASVARDFHVAEDRLLNTYFADANKWESEILVEAMDLWADLNTRKYIVVEPDDWLKVVGGIEHALRNPPTHWRPRQRLERLTIRLYRQMENGNDTEAAVLMNRMEGLLEDPDATPEAKRQTALIMAKLGSELDVVKRVLRDELQAPNPWQRSQAAVALIALGDGAGWGQVRADLAGSLRAASETDLRPDQQKAREEAGFASALLLAEYSVTTPVEASQESYLSPKTLNSELAQGSPAKTPQTSQGAMSEITPGVDLVGRTILGGLTGDRSSWSVFFWRYSCNLICALGCKTQGRASGGQLCGECFDEMAGTFSALRGQIDRSAEICRTRPRDGLPRH